MAWGFSGISRVRVVACALLAALVLGALYTLPRAADAGAPEAAVKNKSSLKSSDARKAGDARKSDAIRLQPNQMHQLAVSEVELVPFRVQRAAIGQIAFNEDASTVVLSPFSGRVTRLIGRIGDTVERGSPLFEIDSPEVVQAQTDLIAAVQGLDKTKAQLSLAQRTLNRLSDLLTAKATSVREVDQARSDAAGAELDVKTAEGSLASARNRLRVLVGRSAEEITRVEKERVINPTFVVTSPIPGTIVNRKIGPGQYVRSDFAEPLFGISDLSTMWLKASVPENDIPHVKPGQEIEVRVPALPDSIFKARITAVGAASDAVTRRVVVRSEIANPGSILKSEMFATFKITTGEARTAPAVPAEAVVREGQLSTVWVEQSPLVFQRRKVSIGVEQDNRLQIVSGLSPGERVIGRGAIFVDNEWRQ